ncbi:MAG: 3-oxoacyl-ACP reductase FabG [Deltaproteobacteria bacterium]|jgi:NAD(P)-dependent dehydrogenase (short-subunit alcohol dehydrogenase family)|nr:3-oxoacyl-ACP reductase FabG [Deltaproteobacteria bacterium]MDA8308254.1 3-oxoacyl-ACP reductase FabG [Deltaproteobacteria bacterium]
MEPMNSSKLFGLDGKVALVTGCSRGLGKAIAVGLAESGCSLILAGVTPPEETVRQIENIGSRYITVHLDVSDESSVVQMVEKALSAYNKVDILVNNSGITQTGHVATEDLSVEEWDKIMRVNLRGTFLCSKYIGKHMIESGGGSIVNIASTGAFKGVPRAPAYCASKAGVVLLTKSLALEWARYNIRVNAVAPHYMETDMTKGLMAADKVYSALVNQIPMRRFAKPEEIVGSVLFLSSPAASYLTGTVVVADGGCLTI